MQSSSRANTFEARDWLRILPALLSALLIVTAAVDIFMMVQPALLERWSEAFRKAFSLHPMVSPSTDVLASSLAVASVVFSSAAAIFVVRAVRAAPHLTLAPVWISVCLLSAARVERAMPLPTSTPLFLAVTAVLLIAASALLFTGSRVSTLLGWCLVAAPLVCFALPYVAAPGVNRFGADAWTFALALGLSASGAIGCAYVRSRARGARDTEELDGVDVLDELFVQLERAERCEAHIVELERKLKEYERRTSALATRGPSGQ
jgi:hypothetical protein